MELALGAVLGPLLDEQRLIGTRQIDWIDCRDRVELDHAGLLEGTIEDAVFLAPGTFRPWQQRFIAFDADRFGNVVLRAPVSVFWPGPPAQLAELWDGPTGTVAHERQCGQSQDHQQRWQPAQ